MASAQLPLVRMIKGAPGFSDHAIGQTFVVYKISTKKEMVFLEVGRTVSLAEKGDVWEWIGNPPNLLANGSWTVLDHISLVGSEVRFLDMWGGFKKGATVKILKEKQQPEQVFHLKGGRVLPLGTLGKVFEFVLGLGSGGRKRFKQQTATGFSQAGDPQTSNNNGTTQRSDPGK